MNRLQILYLHNGQANKNKQTKKTPMAEDHSNLPPNVMGVYQNQGKTGSRQGVIQNAAMATEVLGTATLLYFNYIRDLLNIINRKIRFKLIRETFRLLC